MGPQRAPRRNWNLEVTRKAYAPPAIVATIVLFKSQALCPSCQGRGGWTEPCPYGNGEDEYVCAQCRGERVIFAARTPLDSSWITS